MAEEYKTDRFRAQADKLDIAKLLNCSISFEVPENASVDVEGEIFDSKLIAEHLQAYSSHPIKGIKADASDFKAVPKDSLFASISLLGKDDGPCHDEASIYNASQLLQFEQSLAKSSAGLAAIQEQLISSVIESREYKGEHFSIQNMALNPRVEDCAQRISGYKKELEELTALLERPFDYSNDSPSAVESKSIVSSPSKPKYNRAFHKKIFDLKGELDKKLTALEKDQERRSKLVINIQTLDKLGKIEDEMRSLEQSLVQEKIQLEKLQKKLSGKDKTEEAKGVKLPPEENDEKNLEKIAELKRLINQFENIISTDTFKSREIAALQEKNRILQSKLTILEEVQKQNKDLKKTIRDKKTEKNKRRNQKRKKGKIINAEKKADANDEKRNLPATGEETLHTMSIGEKGRKIITQTAAKIRLTIEIICTNRSIAGAAIKKIADIFKNSVSQINAIYSDNETELAEQLNLAGQDILNQLESVRETASHNMKGGELDEKFYHIKSGEKSNFPYTIHPAKIRIKQIEIFKNIKEHAYKHVDSICKLFNAICIYHMDHALKCSRNSLQALENAGLLPNAKNEQAVNLALLTDHFNESATYVLEKQKAGLKLIDDLYFHIELIGSGTSPETNTSNREKAAALDTSQASASSAAMAAAPTAAHITRVAAKTSSPLHTTTASSRNTVQTPSATPSR